MKDYGIAAKKRKEKVMFSKTKMKCSMLQYLHFSGKKREFYQSLHEDLIEPQDFLCKFNYSIPQGKHCIPVCLISYIQSNVSWKEKWWKKNTHPSMVQHSNPKERHAL